MQVERCQIHVGNVLSCVQRSQDISNLPPMLRHNPALIATAEEPFQPTALEADDHSSICNETIVNCRSSIVFTGPLGVIPVNRGYSLQLLVNTSG